MVPGIAGMTRTGRWSNEISSFLGAELPVPPGPPGLVQPPWPLYCGVARGTDQIIDMLDNTSMLYPRS